MVPVPHAPGRDRATSPQLVRAGRWETTRVLTGVFLPLAAQGAVIRRARVVSWAQRWDLDARAGRQLRRLRQRFDGGPVLLRVPRRRIALLLEAEDVDRLLAETPEHFSAATPEKVTALGHFEPDAVLISPHSLRTTRRALNEAVLDTGQSMHRLAAGMVTKIREEAEHLLARDQVLDWPALALAHGRLVRRIVLGDAAADDRLLTDLLDQLRRDGNWAWLMPRREKVRERFDQRLARHLQRAEPGSLAELVDRASGTPRLQPYGQVPHWLFAFDAVGATVMRTLAALAAYPAAMNRVWAELRGVDLSRPQELPYLRACVLETVRLWPTTLAILRESRVPTVWRGRVMPPRTSVVVISSYFHRDRTRVPYADDFVPDAWLDGRAVRQPGIVPFSAGPARCAGEDLVLFTATTLLAALLQKQSHASIGTQLDPRRLPHTLDHTRLAMAFEPSPRESSLLQARPAAADEPDFADEHKSVTFAFEMSGGPEGRREEGSPRGLAGAD